jgi:hypothetical protein
MAWEINPKYWSQNLNEEDHLRHLGVAGKMNLKWILEVDYMV